MKKIIKYISGFVFIAFVIYTYVLRFKNPDATTIRFFIDYWPLLVLECVSAATCMFLKD